MCTKRMIDTLTPVYNKFTIYNSCVNFLKNGTNREKRPYHTHTPSLSGTLTHIIIWYFIYNLAFSKFALLQAGCYFFLRVHYNYYYDTPKLFNCTPLIFHNQVYLIDYYHLAKQLVECIHEDHVDGLLEYPQV